MERRPDAHVLVGLLQARRGASMPDSGPRLYSADFDPRPREPSKLDLVARRSRSEISLRRSRADWPIVLAAGLMCTLAATLLAAGVHLRRRGLDRRAPSRPRRRPGDRGERRGLDTARAGRSRRRSTRSVTAAIDEAPSRRPAGGSSRYARSDTFALPDQPPGEVRELAMFGYAEGIDDHATLVAGAWPIRRRRRERAGHPGRRQRPTSPTRSASGLGDRLGRGEPDPTGVRRPGPRSSAVFRIDDPADPFWWDEPQIARDGVSHERAVHDLRPVLHDAAEPPRRATPSQVEFGWHAFPDVGATDARRSGATSAPVSASSTPGIADDRRLAGGATCHDRPAGDPRRGPSSRCWSAAPGVLVLTIQLVASRSTPSCSAPRSSSSTGGSTPRCSARAAPDRHAIVGMALIEGVRPRRFAAALVGSVAGARRRSTLFDLVGPLADIGLRLDPEVGTDAYIAAPRPRPALPHRADPARLPVGTVVGRRSTAGWRAGRPRSVGQRLGLDLALLVVAAIGLFQLRQYGGAADGDRCRARSGVDPLLIATPAIGLLAGAIVALRIIPLARAAGSNASHAPRPRPRPVARVAAGRATPAALHAGGAAADAGDVDGRLRGLVRGDVDRPRSDDQATLPGRRRSPRATRAGVGMRCRAAALDPALRRRSPDVTARLPGRPRVDAPSRRPARRRARRARCRGRAGRGHAAVRPRRGEPLADLLAPLAAARPTVEAVRLPGEPTPAPR